MLSIEFSSQNTFKSGNASQNQKDALNTFCSAFHSSNRLHTAFDNADTNLNVLPHSGF